MPVPTSSTTRVAKAASMPAASLIKPPSRGPVPKPITCETAKAPT